MIDIRVPFSGFYNSMHSSSVDEAVNQHTVWLLKQTQFDEVINDDEFDVEMPSETIVSMVSDNVDYDAVNERICEKFVAYFKKLMRFEDFELSMKFKGVWSPREYNFLTNQITCEISETDFEKLFTLTNSIKAFEIVLKEKLTSRPGFISSYSNDKQWWVDNFATLTPDAKYILGYLCLNALAIDIDGHSSTWEQSIWEDMCGDDVYGAAVAEFCNTSNAAFKLGMYVQDLVYSQN